MRDYRIDMTNWGISRWAYDELKAFCRQYPEKKAQADALLGIRSTDHVVEYTVGTGNNKRVMGTVMPRGNMTSNPVEETIVRRMQLLADCELIEQTARSVSDGQWYDALIQHCCHGKGYAEIAPHLLPTSHRNAFFRAKREFYIRLHANKNGTHGAIWAW